MKIIYFTSSTITEDFNARIKTRPTNPSNQHFHRSLIKAFSLAFPTIVISSSFPSKKFEQKNHPRYYFINETSNPSTSLQKRLNKFLDSLELDCSNSIFVIDSLNYKLAKCAREYANKHQIKTLGIISDNPFNISNLSLLKKIVMAHSLKKYDAYFSLTDGLNQLANRKNRPNLTISGCIDIREAPQALEHDFTTPFLFFGGALYKKYGVKTLIDAFIKSKSAFPLYIAGHGPLANHIKDLSKIHPTIRFLGLINQNEVNKCISNALVCINPRPFTANFDKYSVPSKVIEYASQGAIILSTLHSDLFETFNNSIFWLSEDDEVSLTSAINDLQKMDFEQVKMNKEMVKNITIDNFSIQTVSRKLGEFIGKLFPLI